MNPIHHRRRHYRLARRAVHRAHQFVTPKRLKGAETYLLNRMEATSWSHPVWGDPLTYFQSWLFDSLSHR